MTRTPAGELRSVLRSVVSTAPDLTALHDHVARHGLRSLTECALRNGVAGLLGSAVPAAGLDAVDGAAEVAAETQRARLQHVRAVADLGAVGRALSGTGTPILVVKGPALVRRWYRPGERGCADLDVVVPPGSFAGALGALEDAGFVLLDANWPLLRREQVAQLRLRAPSGGLVDLHWHLLNEAGARAVHDLGRDVWEPHAEEVELGGAVVGVLRPEFALVHLCVHAAASGAHRLVWLADVDRVARDVDDWDEVEQVVLRAGVRPATGLVLARARRVLGTPVPTAVLRTLLPWAARLSAGAVDRVSPVPGTTGAGSSAQLVARSAAATWPSTAGRVAARGGAWLRYGSRSADRSASALFDVDDPRSAVHPAGGPAGRADYLDWVGVVG